MLPTLVIVGRPNVGKSTLFNCLTKTRDALVADWPGLTRDRLYGQGQVGGIPYIVVDTGGLGVVENGIEELMAEQTRQAVADADHVLFLVDARAGLLPSDNAIAQSLRETGKAVTLVVNKVDGLDTVSALTDFYALGFGEPQPISAAHQQGIQALAEEVLSSLPEVECSTSQTVDEPVKAIKIAVAGRPNVGKSTLINRLLGEERVVVFDQPGTTRDSIYIPYQRYDKNYVLIDTAGVRRRRSVTETIEKFSIIKTLQAIESAHVVILVIDAREPVTEQDLHLLGFVLQAGKGLVIAFNKWDGLSTEQRDFVRKEIERRLVFAEFAAVKFISALHGTGVGELYPLLEQAYFSATQKFSTSQLTNILEQAVKEHQPPLAKGRRIKLRYAHSGGHNPPIIVVHGKQTRELPGSYKRYLESYFRQALRLQGTPIRIELRDGNNPFVKSHK